MSRITAVDLLRGKNIVKHVTAVLFVETQPKVQTTSVRVRIRRKRGRFLHFEG